MDAIKQTINDLPAKVTIDIPQHLIHRKAEIIILTEDEEEGRKKKKLSDFFGSIPDFPDRFPQGDFENRAHL